MASTGTIIATNASRAVGHTYPEFWADVSVNGGNPYVPGTGLAVTTASLQALLTTAGVVGLTVSAIARVEDGTAKSTDGAYMASWDGTGLLHFVTATGIEAGAVDLSAATKDVVARVWFSVTQ
jgi:hypothetical protein